MLPFLFLLSSTSLLTSCTSFSAWISLNVPLFLHFVFLYFDPLIRVLLYLISLSKSLFENRCHHIVFPFSLSLFAGRKGANHWLGTSLRNWTRQTPNVCVESEEERKNKCKKHIRKEKQSISEECGWEKRESKNPLSVIHSLSLLCIPWVNHSSCREAAPNVFPLSGMRRAKNAWLQRLHHHRELHLRRQYIEGERRRWNCCWEPLHQQQRSSSFLSWCSIM